MCYLHLHVSSRIGRTYKNTEYMWVTKEDLISMKGAWGSDRGIAYCESLLEGAKEKRNPDKRWKHDPAKNIYRVLKNMTEGAYDGSEHSRGVALIFLEALPMDH